MRLNINLGGLGSRFPLPRPTKSKTKPIVEALPPIIDSPASADSPKQVVVVMDGMKGFTTEPLEWTLQNVITAGCTVTLLGVMPWLNIPLSSKMWLDVWPVEFEDLPTLQEKCEGKTSDVKYLKLQAVMDLCKKYGVRPQKEVAMGYPTKLLAVEKITSLHATWVVFDRHQRKNIEFYAERIPCNMVMMNGNGAGDMIRGRRSIIDSEEPTPFDSPASLAPTPQVIISEELKKMLFEKLLQEDDKD